VRILEVMGLEWTSVMAGPASSRPSFSSGASGSLESVEGEIVMAVEGVSTMVRVAITSLRVYSI